jgi:hypothetical protein
VSPFEDALSVGSQNTWGGSSANFRFGGCVFCHPGGGALEYDRDGYRYDALVTGANPNKGAANGPVAIVDGDGTPMGATNVDGIRYGDYWVFDPAAAVVQGLHPLDLLESKAGATAKGVTEVDCLMCHLDALYNNEDRNYCSTKPGMGGSLASKLGATFGLTYTGELDLTSVQIGAEGINPGCTGFDWTDGVLDAALIAAVPKKENCALCHFPEAVPAVSKATGPAHAPLDWTVFQKFIDVGTFVDSDSTVGANNIRSYDVAKGRAEFGKRGESINDPGNPDAHMDATSPMTCSVCHYKLSGDFPALIHEGICSTDGVTHCISDEDCGGGADTCVGDVVQIAKTGVEIMDHQFAKGNNLPDGKNMDQLDNTVTCEGCHDGTPNHQNVVPDAVVVGQYRLLNPVTGTIVPQPTHAAFPAFHIDKIACRTCHIPETNFLKKQMLADYSTTPYPNEGPGPMGGIGRGQDIIKKVDPDGAGPLLPKPVRLHLKPLYGWLDFHGDGDYKLIPYALGSATVWKDLSNGLPYAKRFATEASVMYRDSIGDVAAPLDNIKDFSLNNPQNGDTALIVNTTTEIAGMVATLRDTVSGAFKIQDPALNIYVNTFTSSHNVAVASKSLGSQSTGACAACHSDTSPIFTSAPIDTNPLSACQNQPEGCKGLVFFQPKDGGVGLEMTCDGGDCDKGTKRITNAVGFKCPDGSTITIDLTEGVAHGKAVNNVIQQEDVLCYAPQYLLNLMAPQSSAYFANLKAEFNWLTDATVSRRINLNGSFSLCPPGQVCTYSWDYGEAAAAVNATDPVKPAVTYTAAGSYNVTLTVEDEHGYTATKTRTVLATDIAAVTVPTAAAVDNADGTATLTVTAGVVNLKSIYALWNDGSAVQPVNAYNMTSRTVTHQFVGAPNTFTMAVYVIDMQDKGQLIWLAPLAVTGP